MKPYLIFFIIVLAPTLIVTNYLRVRWNNCGKIIKEQEKIYLEKIKPAQKESLKILFKETNEIGDNENAFESAFESLSILNNIVSMASGARGLYEIYEKGKGMKVPSAVCKAHANQYYRRWLGYPIKEMLKEVNRRDYYSIYERYYF